MEIKEIIWKREQHSESGWVDSIKIFSIYYNSMRSKYDPEDPKGGYILSNKLPGMKEQKCKGFEEGKVLAKKILNHFVNKMIKGETK